MCRGLVIRCWLLYKPVITFVLIDIRRSLNAHLALSTSNACSICHVHAECTVFLRTRLMPRSPSATNDHASQYARFATHRKVHEILKFLNSYEEEREEKAKQHEAKKKRGASRETESDQVYLFRSA